MRIRDQLGVAAPRLAVLLGVAGMLASASAPARAEDTLKQMKEQGFARLAIANEPPFTAVGSDGKVSGAGPDIARAVLKKLGVPDVQASISEYGAMIPGLQAHRFDLIDAGLFMKPERCRAVAYSQPDLCDAESMAVKKGNPMHLESYKDIADNPKARVGAPGGGSEERLALQAGVPRDRVIVVPDGPSGIKMLEDGRIDAYSLPVLSINDLLKKAADSGIEAFSPVKGTPVSCAGAAFRREDASLRDAYDKVLADMKQSGEFAKIVEPYGFNAKLAMSTTRDQLCGAK